MRRKKGFILWVTPARLFWVVCLGWVLGAVSTIFSGHLSTFDLQLHDTYIVIAHIHLFASLAVVFGAFGLFYHFNRRMGRALGLIHFWLTFLGSLVFLVPYFDFSGMPRRYMDYSTWGSIGHTIDDVIVVLVLAGLVAQVVFVVNVVYSMAGGRKSVD